MKKRLDYIDNARGLLIIITIIGHIWQTGYIHNLIYSFHMPAFFVISGMLMSYTNAYKRHIVKFFWERVYAFGIPFITIEILGCLTDIIRHGITLNIKGYVYNTVTMNFNDPNLWFLVDLFSIELLFVLLIKGLKNDKMMWFVCIVLFIISLVLPEESTYINRIVSVFRNFLFFSVGFYGRKILSCKRNSILILNILIVILVPMIFGKRSNGYFSLANMAFILSGFAGTYIVLQLGKVTYRKILEYFLGVAGKNTIVIYGTHHIIYIVIGMFMGITDYTSTPLVKGVLMLILVILFEIPIIYITNRYLPFLAGKSYVKKNLDENLGRKSL